MWVEVTSLIPHLLHNGQSRKPSRWRCLFRVLCPERRPVTTLHWVLLNVRNLALAPGLGPEIISRACLWVSPRARYLVHCWLANQGPSIFCMSRLETPRAGSDLRNRRAEPPFASSSAISLPRTPACSGTQCSPTACRVETLFNAFWHWWTKRVVVDSLKRFQSHLSIRQILTYFSDLFWYWIS